MAHIPTFEEILLQIHQAVGLERTQSKHGNLFSELGFPLERQQEFATRLLEEIFSALEMDPQAQADAILNIGEWVGFDRAVAAHTWTHEASSQQVIWHLLAYSWIPGLARRLAFWSLAGAERGIAFDAGMPGGRFWFLPDWDQDGKRVHFPVAQVTDWLFDLLGDQSLERATEGLRRETGERRNENALRRLQSWRLEGILPKSVKMIDELFHEGAELDYQGSFQPNASLPPEERFAAALAFIADRRMQAAALALEIPLAASLIQAIIDGDGEAADRERFVDLLAIRYAAPSIKTIRQRFHVARLMQYGYERLVHALSGDDADPQSPNVAQNRFLPLLALFQTVYNLTIASVRHGETSKEQDDWFESQFAPWDRYDLLLSIMPSMRDEAAAALGNRLTRRFALLHPNAPLQDLVPIASDGMASSVIQERIQLMKLHADEDTKIRALMSTVRRSSPWRAIQAEQSYAVASHLAVSRQIPAKIREMAIVRMRELAATPAELGAARLAELALLVLGPVAERPSNVQARVDGLLEGLEARDGYEAWKAPLLRLRARHRLMQNDLEGACEDFRSALKASLERSYGALRFEIAEEGWATDIARNGLVPRNQAQYFRHIVQSPNPNPEAKSFEDAAVACEALFWDELYQPYAGVGVLQGKQTDELKNLILQALELIEQRKFVELTSWLIRHQRKFRRARMQDARQDSLLLLWMKSMAQFKKLYGQHARIASVAPPNQIPLLTELRQAIRILVELWPEQVRLRDFKGQTPLMLAADDGDVEMVILLADKSDVDEQDYLGRTALHAATSSNSADCVALILDINPQVSKVTLDEKQTALHTAVRFGNVKAVALIYDAFPGCAECRNAAGQTPLDLAKDLAGNFKQWQAFMKTRNRRTGSQADFDAVVRLLQSD